MTTLESLSRGKYLSLTTFRKDGRAVATPVWFAPDGDTLLVTTDAASGKVKRIRNNAEVLVGPCDMRGRPTGPTAPAHAVLADPADTPRITQTVARRYGLMGRLMTRRGRDSRQGLVLTLTPTIP